MMLRVKHASRTYSSVIIYTPKTVVFMMAFSKNNGTYFCDHKLVRNLFLQLRHEKAILRN